MNKKGQALIEFILIIPLFVTLIISAIDIIGIYYEKIKLDNVLEEVLLNQDYPLEKNIKLTVAQKDNQKTYYLAKDININSPMLVPFLSNDYEIKVQRTIYEE